MIDMNFVERIRVNDTHTYKCVYYSEDMTYNTWRIVLVCSMENISDTLTRFKDIEKLEILEPSSDVIKKVTTRFSTYETVAINPPTLYIDSAGNPIETIILTLKKTDLEDSVRKIEEKLFPTINYTGLTVDEYKDVYIGKFGEACQEKIFAGVDVETEYGLEHFSATFTDQSNIKTLSDTAMNFKISLPYHADSSQCKIYTCTDIVKIYCAIQKLILSETTYCNALNTYVRSLETKAEIASVSYGQELPVDITEAMNAAIAQGEAVMDSIYNGFLAQVGGTDEVVS